MNTDPTRAPWQLLSTGGSAGATGTVSPAGASTVQPAEREKIAALAREFEAFFVFQLVKQMRQSMLDDEDGEGLGASTMTDTMDVELGRQLANAGGIGLAQILQTAIERQVGTSGSAQSAAGQVQAGYAAAWSSSAATVAYSAASSAAYSAAGSDAALPLPVAAPLSSEFGWRTDPLDGTQRFHRGVDISAAYGREVPAAGAGRVVFSGAQGGYGNTVVIEHVGGIRTRYAHLSSIQVETGAQVDSGTVIGRVGSTGRSTGPHLHFEVLQDGQPVDPEAAAVRYAGQLKFGGMVADSPNSQPSLAGVAAGVDDEDTGQ